MHFRPTCAVINLKALKHNYTQVAKRIPKGCGILAMVKADAYGHGAVPVAKTFAACGAAAFGVVTVEEGIELREAGIRTKILVMGGLCGVGAAAAKALLENCLTPVVHSADDIDLLGVPQRRPTPLGGTFVYVHLKIDTGMSRLGVTPQALPDLLQKLKQNPHLKLEGVMTHLAWRQDAEYTRHQTQLFEKMGERIRKTFGEIPVWHIANSAAVIAGEPIQFGWKGKYWVRPGIMLYGIPPYPEFLSKINLKPVLSLVSQVSLVKNLPAKTKVSYNCTFTTKRPSCIGVVPIGYADGYPWSVSNRAEVLVEGRRVPVVGRVTMDMIMVDLTDCPKAKVGSEAVMMGRQGKEAITADELAAWAQTIPYEIVCRVSKRMPRIYQK